MPHARDIMLTAEELRLRRVKRRRILIIAVSLVVVVAVVVFAGHPIAGAIKGWQSRRHAARVVALLDKQQWNDARDEALAAYQLRPNEPEAIRAVARYLSRTRQHQALEFWEQLAKQQSLTRDDLRDEATVALMSGEMERAAPIVKSLVDRKDAGPPDWFLGTQLALQKGNSAEAQSYLRRILDASSASERDQLQATVAELTISSGDDSASASTSRGCAQSPGKVEPRQKRSRARCIGRSRATRFLEGRSSSRSECQQDETRAQTEADPNDRN